MPLTPGVAKHGVRHVAVLELQREVRLLNLEVGAGLREHPNLLLQALDLRYVVRAALPRVEASLHVLPVALQLGVGLVEQRPRRAKRPRQPLPLELSPRLQRLNFRLVLLPLLPRAFLRRFRLLPSPRFNRGNRGGVRRVQPGSLRRRILPGGQQVGAGGFNLPVELLSLFLKRGYTRGAFRRRGFERGDRPRPRLQVSLER